MPFRAAVQILTTCENAICLTIFLRLGEKRSASIKRHFLGRVHFSKWFIRARITRERDFRTRGWSESIFHNRPAKPITRLASLFTLHGRALLISLHATFSANMVGPQRQIGPTGMRGVNIGNFARRGAMHARALLFMAGAARPPLAKWIFASFSLVRSLCSAHGRKFGGTRVKCQDEAITVARILN
jgi:hypothetical protein